MIFGITEKNTGQWNDEPYNFNTKKYIYNTKYQKKDLSIIPAKIAIVNLIKAETLKPKGPKFLEVYSRLV